MKSIILTEEDKNILRKVARYLRSYNLSSGVIQIENDFYYDPVGALERTTNFSNNWSVEIPDFFKPYLEEIVTKALRNLDDLDIDDVNYDHIEIEIVAAEQQLEITRYYGYEQPGDSGGVTWGDDTDDTEMVEEILSEIRASDATINSDGIVRLNYAGSGDSGYIENSFDGGGRVPAAIEDWCYQRLENNYGGWEINEGSNGYFLFNLSSKIIELEHTFNELVEETEDVISVYFGK